MFIYRPLLRRQRVKDSKDVTDQLCAVVFQATLCGRSAHSLENWNKHAFVKSAAQHVNHSVKRLG